MKRMRWHKKGYKGLRVDTVLTEMLAGARMNYENWQSFSYWEAVLY